MDTAFLITAFATLFVVIDPPGLVPMFIALTSGMDRAHRATMARRACVIAFVLLTLFGLMGEALLGFIGISMPAFRIAGGILLFLTALDKLFERRTQRREGQTPDADHDPSVFPLATPLIAGPGAIATMILLMGQIGQQLAWRGCGAGAFGGDDLGDLCVFAGLPAAGAAFGAHRNCGDHPPARHAFGSAFGAICHRRRQGHRADLRGFAMDESYGRALYLVLILISVSGWVFVEYRSRLAKLRAACWLGA